MTDDHDAGPPATVFNVGEWLAERLGCAVDELLQIPPALDHPNRSETWRFGRSGTDVHGVVAISRPLLGVRGVTALWGPTGSADTSIGADDVVRW